MTHANLAITTLLNGVLEGALLALAMGLFLKALPRLNSATRFGVLWVTLLATVALLAGPFTRGAFFADAHPDARSMEASGEPALAMASPVKIEKVEPSFATSHRTADVELPPAPAPHTQMVAQPVPQFVEAEIPATSSRWAPLAAITHPVIHIHSGKLLNAFEIAWALLSLIMMGRLGFGYWRLRTWKAGAEPLPAEWQQRLECLRGFNGVSRSMQLLVSSEISAPMSLGFLHPAILIPQSLLETLSDDELEHVVLHELGHLHRRDDWTNLALRLIEAVLPIQPAFYWIGNRMAIEREIACDDWVVAATGTAESYASSLARVAELSHWAQAGMLAAGATGNRSQLFKRVQHMLDKTRDVAPRLTIAPLGAAIAAVAVLIYAGVSAPQMIAFAETAATSNIGPELDATIHTQDSQTSSTAQTSQVSQTLQTPQMPNAPDAVSIPLNSIETSAAPQLTAALEPAAAIAPMTPMASPVSAASPLPAASPRPMAQPQQSSDSHMEMTSRNGSEYLSIKIYGAVEFTDDDRDVKSLSPGGRFRIEQGHWLSGRVYDVKADSSGNLTRTYSDGASTKPLDAEGQAWLAHILPQAIRDSGVGAEARVARILRQGGPAAVINEIGLIHSDGSKRIYIEQLISQATLNVDQLKQAARLIQGIGSDGDKAHVLIDVDGKFFTSELRPNLFDAVKSISSDGDKRRVLSDIVKKDAGSDETLLDAAITAKHISSDGDKAQVLIEMATPYRDKSGVGMAYFDAVKSISSDGDHARVLLNMLSTHGDDRSTLARVLESARNISSDGDKARVLKEAVSRYSGEPPISKVFIDAANSISSDGDHQQVLVALVHRQGIDAATAGEIAKSAQRISSDGDKARVLVELAAVNVEPIRGDFISAANTINSDGDHSRVLLALLDKSGTTSATAIAAVESATRISSDGDKSRVLKDVAQRYSNDPQVNAALRKAVDSVHSDGEYRSVMTEIARHDAGH